MRRKINDYKYRDEYEILGDPFLQEAIANYLIFTRFATWAFCDSEVVSEDLFTHVDWSLKRRELIFKQLEYVPCYNQDRGKAKSLIHTILSRLKLSEKDNENWCWGSEISSHRFHSAFHMLIYKVPLLEAGSDTWIAFRLIKPELKPLSVNFLKEQTLKHTKIRGMSGSFPVKQIFTTALIQLSTGIVLTIFLSKQIGFLPGPWTLALVVIPLTFLLISVLTAECGKSALYYGTLTVNFQASLSKEIEEAIASVTPHREKRIRLPRESKNDFKKEVLKLKSQFTENKPDGPHSNSLSGISNESRKSESSSAFYKVKIKTRPKTQVLSVPKAFKSLSFVQLDWPNPNLPPVQGILRNENGKLRILFMISPVMSQAWSGISSIEIACNKHFFLHDFEMKGSAAEVLRTHQEIAKVGHVVPDKGHTGMVFILNETGSHTKDKDFPGAGYKSKRKEDPWRMGFFNTLRSSPLKLIEDGELKEMPSRMNLDGQTIVMPAGNQLIYELFEGQSLKKTH